MCTQPFLTRSKTGVLQKVRCGRCMECLKQDASSWTGRLLMEYAAHPFCTFATFTFCDKYLPDYGVCKRDMTLLIKRLRQAQPGIRYFGVGEYGGMFARPHYHFLVFNDKMFNSPLWRNLEPDGNSFGFRCHCPFWKFGHVTVEEACTDNIAYCAGYVKSKLDPVKRKLLENGRNPVCNTMSLKPAIGYEYMVKHKDKLIQDGCVRLGGSEYVLSKYFKEHICSDADRLFLRQQKTADFDAQFDLDVEELGSSRLAFKLEKDRLRMRALEHDFKEAQKECGKY